MSPYANSQQTMKTRSCFAVSDTLPSSPQASHAVYTRSKLRYTSIFTNLFSLDIVHEGRSLYPSYAPPQSVKSFFKIRSDRGFEHSTSSFTSPLCHPFTFNQIRPCFFYPTAVLHRPDSLARMTVSGCVTAVDIESDCFVLSLSQPVSGIPGFSPLTIRVSIGFDENFERPNISFPQLHSLLSLTGDLLAVERRVAYLCVTHVALLCPFNPNFDLNSESVPQSLLL